MLQGNYLPKQMINCAYILRKFQWHDALLQCPWPRAHCRAFLIKHWSGCDDRGMRYGCWLAAYLDEQHSTMEWVCECRPPIVLILQIPLEQAFFSVPAFHTFIVLQWTISLTLRMPSVSFASIYSICAVIYLTYGVLNLYYSTSLQLKAMVCVIPFRLFTVKLMSLLLQSQNDIVDDLGMLFIRFHKKYYWRDSECYHY